MLVRLSYRKKVKTVEFSGTVAACDLKDGKYGQLIESIKIFKVKVI